MSGEVIVYRGPSLSQEEAQAALPGCDQRAPIGRGDLYRARQEGGSILVILDGVFLQEPAVAPREIVDVLKDGAVVVGASSMGALRAAECWPAGMHGVGSIYRLYRRGSLQSDDEVALAFCPEGARAALSVPLVNVRYAALRAWRCGRIRHAQGCRMIDVARSMHFTDRRWPEILDAAGIDDQTGALLNFLSDLDLKKKDALRALRLVGRWLKEDPQCAQRARRRDAAPILSQPERERGHDALAGEHPDQARQDLSRWLILSGRYTRFWLSVAAANPQFGLRERVDKKCASSQALEAVISSSIASRQSPHEVDKDDRRRTVALRLVLFELWIASAAEEARFALALWAELQATGELDAELFRCRAVRDAALEARRRSLLPRPRDRFLAGSEIAHAHGFRSWQALREAIAVAPYLWPEFCDYRDQLASAKRWREVLFNPSAAVADRSGCPLDCAPH